MPHVDTIHSLSAGVDKNGVPVGFHWHGRRTFTDDNGVTLGEAPIAIPLTREELAEHISAALAKQADDIAADRIVRDGIAGERDAAQRDVRRLEADMTRERQAQIEERSRLIEMHAAEAQRLRGELNAERSARAADLQRLTAERDAALIPGLRE